MSGLHGQRATPLRGEDNAWVQEGAEDKPDRPYRTGKNRNGRFVVTPARDGRPAVDTIRMNNTVRRPLRSSSAAREIADWKGGVDLAGK
jgi:hypothetical protein